MLELEVLVLGVLNMVNSKREKKHVAPTLRKGGPTGSRFVPRGKCFSPLFFKEMD